MCSGFVINGDRAIQSRAHFDRIHFAVRRALSHFAWILRNGRGFFWGSNWPRSVIFRSVEGLRLCHTLRFDNIQCRTDHTMSRVRHLAINAADHLVRKGRLDSAASILENYLSAHPECGGILRRLGRIRLAQGRADLARPLLEQALKLYVHGARLDKSGTSLPALSE